MSDVMASLLGHVHLCRAELNLFHNGNGFLIASTVSAYSLQQMLLMVGADNSTRSARKALFDRRSSRFDKAFHGMWTERNPNIGSRFHLSWWNSEVSKSLPAILEHFVCHFGQYGSTWKSNMIFLCELTIVIPRLHCLVRIGKAVSSTTELVNSVTTDSVNSSHFAMWAFASKCFTIELVPCSDGWLRT